MHHFKKKNSKMSSQRGLQKCLGAQENVSLSPAVALDRPAYAQHHLTMKKSALIEKNKCY